MVKLDPTLFHSWTSMEEALEESARIDESLGLKIPEIEKFLLEKAKELNPSGNLRTFGHSLHAGNQTWVGLDLQTLQTPYAEIKLICDLLKPKAGQKIVDLGAGYGRMGLILETFYPGVLFTGYELVEQRVREGNRIFQELKCSYSQLLEQDLGANDFDLPEAQYYFLYDYGKVEHIKRTLEQLEVYAEKKNFRLVARGKGVRSLIQVHHPWLWDIYPAIHHETFSIYTMSGDF